jgi:nitrogen fixation NifU-like protein
MAKDFDKMVEELNEKIMEDMRKIYSKKAIDYFLHPRNLGKIDDPDGYGKVTGPCGDTMEIFLKVINGRIAEANFMTDGCGTTVVCGTMVTELVKGKSINDAGEITQYVILENLGGLPESDQHCALLASNTLREALKDYRLLEREPWKRAYRRI